MERMRYLDKGTLRLSRRPSASIPTDAVINTSLNVLALIFGLVPARSG